MVGRNLKRKFLNKKIIIYQMPLFERIMGLFSIIVLTLIAVFGLINCVEKFEMSILLCAVLIYSGLMFFCIFKTFICLDISNKIIIIREFPGIKKQVLSLYNFKNIKISDGIQKNQFFTIEINYVGYSIKIDSWSTHPSCRLAFFNVYRRQVKRLNKFILRCERSLKN